MNGYTWIGWVASSIVFVTIALQLTEQWKAGSKGVSKWMFLGNSIATTGFVIYSYTQGDTVFLTANSIILLGHLAGMVLTFKQKQQEQ